MSDDGDVRFRCPGCDDEVDVPAVAVGELVRCPYCNSDFFAADGRTHEVVVDDTEPVADDAPDPDQLDANRIRQLSALRMAIQRTRSWWLTGTFLAALTALNCLIKAVTGAVAAHRWGAVPTWLTLATVVATLVALWTARHARRLAREAVTGAPPGPFAEPDFSPLDNGSERWRRLDEVR